jgi:hypothetical protein
MEPCSTPLLASPFISTFFTTKFLTSSPTHPYRVERALPGNFHSRKLSSVSPLLNVVSRTTHPLSLFSLSLRLQRVNVPVYREKYLKRTPVPKHNCWRTSKTHLILQLYIKYNWVGFTFRPLPSKKEPHSPHAVMIKLSVTERIRSRLFTQHPVISLTWLSRM